MLKVDVVSDLWPGSGPYDNRTGEESSPQIHNVTQGHISCQRRQRRSFRMWALGNAPYLEMTLLDSLSSPPSSLTVCAVAAAASLNMDQSCTD